jgi:hypothetical protein
MAVKLSRKSLDHARSLIAEGRSVSDDRDDWSEHQPSAEDENRFIEKHGWAEFGLWHLAVDDDARPETKAHYKFPYGDFSKLHRCAVLSAESRAAQRDHDDVRAAAARLHEMLDGSATKAHR